MNIQDLYYNDILIPAGYYTQDDIMKLIDADYITLDNKTYIKFANTPNENTTLSNCYYFHNLQIGVDSCLDAIYEVITEDTTINLVNYTETITLNYQLVDIIYGVSTINGQLWGPVSKRSRITGDVTFNDYLTQYCSNITHQEFPATLNVYSNKYYISSSAKFINPIAVNSNKPYDEWNPIEENCVLNYDNIYLYNYDNEVNWSRSDTLIQYILPADYLLYGQPVRFMDQFKKVTKINIPPGVYTFSDFVNVLSTTNIDGYAFDKINCMITPTELNNPMYNFMIETSLFNIPQHLSYSLTIEDPLKDYDKIIFVNDNQHEYYDLKDGVLIMKDNVPTTIPTVQGINVLQSNEKFIQLLQSEELYFNIFQTTDKINIPVNPNYKNVRIYGFLLNLDIINTHTVNINNNEYNVSISENIDDIYTQPLTISGNNNIILSCRIQYINPI